ncbi:molybdenum cofactor biosynthesis F family protein [Microbacterium terricola]|nr:molybdenum cofactor biosynthesis F family protein [Microbacterium terricola]UYK40045.1 molybdenum cofactor biosynthesis F family protein [Microbacterium terricola]
MTNDQDELILGDESPDWLNMEDFAQGIDTNRVPRTDALTGRTVTVDLSGGGSLTVDFDETTVTWTVSGVDWAGGGTDAYEAVPVGVGAFWVDFSIAERQVETITLVFSPPIGWGLVVHSVIQPEDFASETRVTQTFHPGRVVGAPTGGPLPAPTRDLIGKRTLFRYSSRHLYEHIYLSSRRFVWHNLIGEQRGHAAAELTTTYKLEEGMYLFTWREEKIPVGTVFVFDYARGRSTGKFIGLTGDGVVANSPGGAEILEFGYSDYADFADPV